MATSNIYITGKIMWAGGLKTKDPEYGTYNAQLIVTPEFRDRLEEAGCQATFKKADGGYQFKIKGDSKRNIWDKDLQEMREVEMSPPEVFLEVDGKRSDLDPARVGNGSDVIAKLELYDTKKGGKGTRLKAVRVENWIEFTPQVTEVIDTGVEPF